MPSDLRQSVKDSRVQTISAVVCKERTQEAQVKPWAKHFYSSKAWKNCREYVRQRDHRLCVDCMQYGYFTPAEEVHHIIELTPDNINDPSITLNPDNLVSLCKECHKKRHGGVKRYKVDEFGRVIASS